MHSSALKKDVAKTSEKKIYCRLVLYKFCEVNHAFVLVCQYACHVAETTVKNFV